MKTTTAIITALLCHASIVWGLPNFNLTSASPALQQPQHQPSSPSPPRIQGETWQCKPIAFPDDLCLCVPIDCQLGPPDCWSVYISKGVLGCDQACNGCRPDECHQSLCNSTVMG
ncbi:hypothetical protein PG997_009289 [Apiospora hydei]|uniref:Uncharacterized protein n=1 Tax=Apiospora hydei TaxID=1337664 RepID=A0ABR1VTN7_9PEZI